MQLQETSGDAGKYKKISQLYTQIVDTLTTKDIGQIKLYFVNLSKKITEKSDNFYQDFSDLTSLLNNLKEAKGKVALHYAVAKGDVQIVKYMIEILKVDYETKDKEGNTPFFTAVQHGSLSLTKYFIQQLKVSPHSTKDGNITALHIAANNNHTDIIKYLINQGCDIQKMSIYGKPINWAVGNRHLQATKVLLEHGADANGDTTCPAPPPLILAIDFGCKQIYRALLSAPQPADFNIKDPQGYTALHVAAQKGDLQIVKDLTIKGAEPNAIAHDKTPLYLAFMNAKWDVVSYLRTLTKNHEQIEKKVSQAKKAEEEKLAANPIDKEKAQKIKQEGNEIYKEKKYELALQKYQQALKFDPQNEILHRNMAACYLPLQKYQQALEHCHKAKLVDGKNVKTLYRQAQAYVGLGELIEAASSFWQCAMLEPQNKFFKQQFQKYVALAKQKHA